MTRELSDVLLRHFFREINRLAAQRLPVEFGFDARGGFGSEVFFTKFNGNRTKNSGTGETPVPLGFFSARNRFQNDFNRGIFPAAV